jgi:hypothetical protein
MAPTFDQQACLVAGTDSSSSPIRNRSENGALESDWLDEIGVESCITASLTIALLTEASDRDQVRRRDAEAILDEAVTRARGPRRDCYNTEPVTLRCSDPLLSAAATRRRSSNCSPGGAFAAPATWVAVLGCAYFALAAVCIFLMPNT